MTTKTSTQQGIMQKFLGFGLESLVDMVIADYPEIHAEDMFSPEFREIMLRISEREEVRDVRNRILSIIADSERELTQLAKGFIDKYFKELSRFAPRARTKEKTSTKKFEILGYCSHCGEERVGMLSLPLEKLLQSFLNDVDHDTIPDRKAFMALGQQFLNRYHRESMRDNPKRGRLKIDHTMLLYSKGDEVIEDGRLYCRRCGELADLAVNAVVEIIRPGQMEDAEKIQLAHRLLDPPSSKERKKDPALARYDKKRFRANVEACVRAEYPFSFRNLGNFRNEEYLKLYDLMEQIRTKSVPLDTNSPCPQRFGRLSIAERRLLKERTDGGIRQPELIIKDRIKSPKSLALKCAHAYSCLGDSPEDICAARYIVPDTFPNSRAVQVMLSVIDSTTYPLMEDAQKRDWFEGGTYSPKEGITPGPKENGYRSAHRHPIMSICGKDIPVSLQVRTYGWDFDAEQGEAFHPGYKRERIREIAESDMPWSLPVFRAIFCPEYFTSPEYQRDRIRHQRRVQQANSGKNNKKGR